MEEVVNIPKETAKADDVPNSLAVLRASTVFLIDDEILEKPRKEILEIEFFMIFPDLLFTLLISRISTVSFVDSIEVKNSNSISILCC